MMAPKVKNVDHERIGRSRSDQPKIDRNKRN
jgi:hypothetical protein